MPKYPLNIILVVVTVLIIGSVSVFASSDRVKCALLIGIRSCETPELILKEPVPIIEVATIISTTTPTSISTSTPPATSTIKVTEEKSKVLSKLPGVVVPVQQTVTTVVTTASEIPPTVIPQPTPTPIPTPVIVPVIVEEGPTTFSVSAIPLLVGGNARGGTSVPLSYLKIVNTGSASARLKGFWVQQNGSASTQVIIGLSTVDDKGESRGQVGGVEGSSPFINNQAFAPTDALFAPGQMRLFTIKGILASDISAYVGTQLMIDVSSLDAKDVTFTNLFPIRGTTWTLVL